MVNQQDNDKDKDDNNYQIFELGPADAPPGGTGRGPGIGRWVAIAVGIALIGGVAWYLLNSEVQETATEDGVPVVTADPGPIKKKPEPGEEGGMEVPDRGKSVYDRASGSDAATQQGQVEQILPGPEEPKTPPSGSEEAETGQAPAVAADDAATKTQQQAEKSPGAAATDGKSAFDTSEGAPTVEEVQSAPAPKPEPVQSESEKKGVADAYFIQLTARRSEADANAAWERIVAANKDILGDYKPLVIRADLGEKGVFYRLRTGPFRSREDAADMCLELKRRKVSCFPVKGS